MYTIESVMSNFIDLNDLKNLLPQPDVTQAPPPESIPPPLPPPPQTIPPPQTFTPSPSPTAAPPPIIVNVPEPKDKDDYPRSPYWGGSRYYLPNYPQYLGSEVDNSIKTGNISTSWGSNNNNTSTEQQMNTPMTTPPPRNPMPILTLTPAPRAVQQEEGMSMTTKIVLGVCVAILIGGASYMAWRYFKNKKKSKGSNNKNSTTTRRNNTNNTNNNNNNFMNNLGSNNTTTNNNNNNNLPRPPSS
jgi:hypothetical protein